LRSFLKKSTIVEKTKLERGILMTQPIDLRSDTFTKPSPGMRKAMAEAEVGDDVYREDPTVNSLQERTAELFGYEAGLFVPSGSMGNQIAVKVHTQPGQEVIGDSACHIFNYEMGMTSVYSGVLARMVPTERGFLSVDDVRQNLKRMTDHNPPTGLVVVENTHNAKGGGVYPAQQLCEVIDAAHERGVPVHMDGARSLNAAVASDVSPAELTKNIDSVSFCFSKGLGAPIGSMLVGSKDFIEAAHQHRNRLGGAMRQVGILAAACHYALDHNVGRLLDDHNNAKQLGQTLTDVGMMVDPVESNIVFFNTPQPTAFEAVKQLHERGVLCAAMNESRIRMVTHLDVSQAQTQQACDIIKQTLG
jgi:threonine aldolase